MIGRLKGTLVHKQPPWLLVDVGGVGYELEAPMSTFYDLPEAGREVTLHVHHAVKEDSVALYGFLTEAERRADDPWKITSSIFAPRRSRARCSPNTQRTASETLDLPHPFGPTIAVTPGSNARYVVSANDLNP